MSEVTAAQQIIFASKASYAGKLLVQLSMGSAQEARSAEAWVEQHPKEFDFVFNE